MTQYAEKAATQLEKVLTDKVRYTAKDCWPANVEGRLGDMKEMILAAKALGVVDLQKVELEKMPQEKVKAVLNQLGYLRRLDMADEALELLYALLQEAGVPEHYYKYKPRPCGLTC